MEAIKFLEDTKNVNWEYDDEADALYMTMGKPRNAMSIDVGNGTIVRYEEETKEVVGMTFVGIRERFIKQLREAP